MIMTGALGVITPSAVIDKSKMNPNQKKTSATIAGTILGGVGLSMVNHAAKGKSFVWNSKMNKGLKNVATKMGEFVKNNTIANYMNKITKNNKLGETAGKFIQKVANSGANGIKDIATKVAKTSGRQKLLAAVTVGTLALVMAAREHFSKEAGAESQKADDKKIMGGIIKANNIINEKKLEAKDMKIAELETQLEIKENENKALYQTIEKADKAAEKIGVDKQLAAEILSAEEEE